MVWVEPLDLKTIIIEYLLGSVELFILALVLILSLVCAKFGVSTRNYLILLVVSSLILSSYLGQAIYVLIILLVGFVSFKSLAGSFER